MASGAHDLGGLQGFGPIDSEDDEPIFHAEWERRVLGMMITSGYRMISMRPAIENIEPETYLKSSYYERWLIALETGLVDRGVISQEELTSRAVDFVEPASTPSRNDDPGMAEEVLRRQYSQRSERHSGTPRFKPGDRVLVHSEQKARHTRVPRYVRGKLGLVQSVRGVYELLDLKVEGVSVPEPVYSIRFDARELWGERKEGNGSVCIDLWDSYLEAQL